MSTIHPQASAPLLDWSQYYLSREAAITLGLSLKCLYEWRDAGKLQAFQLPGGAFLYLKVEVDALAAARRAAKQAKAGAGGAAR